MEELSDSDDDIPFGLDYDPHGNAWFANLLFWRPSRLSDEQMQLHFSEWDGRWSEQTGRFYQPRVFWGVSDSVVMTGSELNR
ncbi:MAG: hypothetical protein U1E81_15875 [Xanthobacteraceae bacterium]